MIPFEEKKKIAREVLIKYLDLTTPSGRCNFLLCIVFITYTLYNTQTASFHIMMKSLIEAIREGKITKAMARFIIRKLRKKGIPVDPELAELAGS